MQDAISAPKKTRGKRPGQVDFIDVKIDVLSRFIMAGGAVPVRRKFLEQIEKQYNVRLGISDEPETVDALPESEPVKPAFVIEDLS